MSHEGIRIGRVPEGKELPPEPAPLPRDAVTPAKVRVKKTEGTGVEIDWRDGHHSAWSFAWLRWACPCATCVEEREQTGRAVGSPPAEPPSLLPMFKAPPRPEQITPVGNYALKFKWNDGHESGIYSWEYLRRSSATK
jgi:DUF971 family protein